MYTFYVKNVALRRIGVKGVEIRKPEQLRGVDSLIIPGGESTTMAKLAELHNLVSLSLSSFSFLVIISSDTSYRKLPAPLIFIPTALALESVI